MIGVETVVGWCLFVIVVSFFFFFQAEDGIRDYKVTGVQTCALPICIRQLLVQRLAVPQTASEKLRPRWDRRQRSEERRVGKECRSRWSPYHLKKKKTKSPQVTYVSKYAAISIHYIIARSTHARPQYT